VYDLEECSMLKESQILMIKVVIIGLISGFIGGIFAQCALSPSSPYGEVDEDSPRNDTRGALLLIFALIVIVVGIAWLTIRLSKR
jgi:hypothetical protein